MKKLWKPALAALVAASALTGCVTERVVMREPAPHPAAMRPMPAPVAEERGAAPGYGWNWVPGHWRWAGDNWLWVHGKWVQQAVPAMPPVIVEQVTVAPAPHAYWVQGHWVWRYDHGGGWAWVKGSWHG